MKKKTLLKSICELGIRSIFRLVLVIVGGQISILFELKKPFESDALSGMEKNLSFERGEN